MKGNVLVFRIPEEGRTSCIVFGIVEEGESRIVCSQKGESYYSVVKT